jgi:phosphate-selective porin OprO/OprP
VNTDIWRIILLSAVVLAAPAALLADDGEKSKQPVPTALEMLEARLTMQEERIRQLEDLVHEQRTWIVSAREELAMLLPERPSKNAESGIQPAAETRLEIPKTTTAPVQTQGNPVAGWTGSHPFINSADGDFTMQFSGRMHLDYRSFTNDGTPESTFVLRRARLTVEGQLYNRYTYKVETDFADRGSSILRDGYVNAKVSDAIELRFGQFKAPFSQERLQSSQRVNFVDRSSLSELSPGRSPGIMIHGSFLDDAVEYAVSASNGLGVLNSNNRATPEVTSRLRFKPFQSIELLENFAFGGAFGQGRRAGGLSFRGRTASRSVTFFGRVPVNGKITRANIEFDWLHPKFAIRGEFDQANQRRDGMGTGGGNLPGVVSKGYMFNTAYVFGGVTRTNGAIVPDTTFLHEGGTGALQLVFRYENLRIDDRVNSNRGEAYTTGFNWWLSSFIRHQSNFAFERFGDSNRTGPFNGKSTFTYLGRMQLMF